MLFSKDPEAPLQARLAEIEREEKQIEANTAARRKQLAEEKASIHVKVFEIREQRQQAARAEMLERVRPIDEQLAKLRAKQQELQSRRQYDAANALVAEVSELYRQRRAIVA